MHLYAVHSSGAVLESFGQDELEHAREYVRFHALHEWYKAADFRHTKQSVWLVNLPVGFTQQDNMYWLRLRDIIDNGTIAYMDAAHAFRYSIYTKSMLRRITCNTDIQVLPGFATVAKCDQFLYI